ncbi:hypothetical protein Q5752_002844 [Cryptotrichosporon argae]
MSQPIPRPPHRSPAHLDTPASTPPLSASLTPTPSPSSSCIEARLAALLAKFDDGTHAICREQRESDDERLVAFPVALPTPPSSRRPSFLSSLTLSRPAPLQLLEPIHPLTAHSDSRTHIQPQQQQQQQQPQSSALSSSIPKDAFVGYAPAAPAAPRAHSVPPPAPATTPAGGGPLAPLPRAHTDAPSFGAGPEAGATHFDPSREPRLFGLL